MEFRLIYQGRLPAEGRSGRRTEERHQLRKHFHKQIRELWQQHPHLRYQSEQRFRIRVNPQTGMRQISPVSAEVSDAKTWLEHIADDHVRCGGRFVPLVSEQGGFTCSLDILFLRRDNPGNLVRTGGDIDNRIKLLLDGLKIPKVVEDLGGMKIEDDENPFFCLLKDDSLITKLSVTTDRLLLPPSPTEALHDVLLDIHVTVVNPSAIFAGFRLV